MSADIDIDQIIKAMAAPEVGKNADSLLGMFQEVNKILGEADKILAFVKRLESSILVSAAVQIKAKQAGVELKPLAQPQFEPPTDAHRQICENICKMNTEQLKGLFEALREHDLKNKEVKT